MIITDLASVDILARCYILHALAVETPDGHALQTALDAETRQRLAAALGPTHLEVFKELDRCDPGHQAQFLRLLGHPARHVTPAKACVDEGGLAPAVRALAGYYLGLLRGFRKTAERLRPAPKEG